MAKRLDHIIVIDIESTCWDGPTPHNQETEIIEIGVCPVEVSTGRRLEKRSILVRPERSKVGEFCTRLTTLTQEQVSRGMTFKDACATLRRDFDTLERLWASAGDYDRRMFERQCKATGVAYPFGPSHLNVKTLYALSRGLPVEVGLDAALKLEGLPLEGTHHRGDDDAWNIAALLGVLLRKLKTG